MPVGFFACVKKNEMNWMISSHVTAGREGWKDRIDGGGEARGLPRASNSQAVLYVSHWLGE